MAVLTDYKGLDVVEDSTGAGGIALTDNFKELADRAPYESSSDPTATDDSGKGFSAGDQWLNSSTQVMWVCTDASASDAVWKSFYRRTSTALELIPSEDSEEVAIAGRCSAVGITGGFDVTAADQRATLTKCWSPRTADLGNGWCLDYQDEFALIDRKGGVVTISPAPNSGTAANLFVDDSTTIIYSSGTSPGTIQITVDCSANPIITHGNGTYAIGLTNRSSDSPPNPTHIQIEYWDSSTSAFVTVYDEDVPQTAGFGAWVSPTLFSPDPTFNLIKARVTLTVPSPLPIDFRLQRLMLYHASAVYDPWHLHVLGGTLYGPLTLSSSLAMKAITAPSTPAANTAVLYQDSANQGVCVKLANGHVAQLASYSGVLTKTAAYTVAAGDQVILCNASGGAFTVTLPTAVGLTGRQFTIKRINSGSNNVTIGTTSSQTIDGATTRALTSQYEVVTVVSDGANWWIVS